MSSLEGFSGARLGLTKSMGQIECLTLLCVSKGLQGSLLAMLALGQRRLLRCSLQTIFFLRLTKLSMKLQSLDTEVVMNLIAGLSRFDRLMERLGTVHIIIHKVWRAILLILQELWLWCLEAPYRQKACF